MVSLAYWMDVFLGSEEMVYFEREFGTSVLSIT